ncbi:MULTISPECIES: hypothetical protein [unclassified Bradyrhizobium]|uniref:hypothetical protein n=1 Tax=unclassified Bradyrhizobium TaxID=2631580 RepID=UPI002915F3C3|nr:MULTISPECIES: hypothetical protein [unclassified Bradyrhizobium]
MVVDAGDICCTFQVRSRGGDPLIGACRDPDLTRPRANEMGCGNLSDRVRLQNEYDGSGGPPCQCGSPDPSARDLWMQHRTLHL